MTNEEAVTCLKGIKILGKDIFTRCRYDLDNAVDMAIKALEQEPCEDAVSRKAVLKEMLVLWNGNGDKDYCMESLRDFVTELPPVTPTRKKGKWTKISNTVPCMNCPICGSTFTLILGGDKMHYCPHCGADMRGEEKEYKAPSEWQQDHAILKAHSDGANEVIDRIKEAITALDNAYEELDGYDPDALGTYKCRVDEVFSKLIAEVEGKDATERK